MSLSGGSSRVAQSVERQKNPRSSWKFSASPCSTADLPTPFLPMTTRLTLLIRHTFPEGPPQGRIGALRSRTHDVAYQSTGVIVIGGGHHHRPLGVARLERAHELAPVGPQLLGDIGPVPRDAADLLVGDLYMKAHEEAAEHREQRVVGGGRDEVEKGLQLPEEPLRIPALLEVV